MFSRLGRQCLAFQKGRRFRLQSISNTVKHRQSTTESQSQSTSFDVSVFDKSPTIEINTRKNKPGARRDTIWLSWYSWNQISMAHILLLVRYVEMHFGPVNDFAVVRVNSLF